MPLFNKDFFKDSAFGWDGLNTFVFSNSLILLSLGLGFFYLLTKVLWLALRAETQVAYVNQQYPVLIAGLRLHNNQISLEFKQRLERAKQLPGRPVIILLGGVTANNTVSEARAGELYLLQQGVEAERIIKEQQSRHTLENMQYAYALLRPDHPEAIAVISSRYHLYRLSILARSAGIKAIPVAAESRLRVNGIIVMRMLKEAYYLHWFFSGKLWLWISNKCSKGCA